MWTKQNAMQIASLSNAVEGWQYNALNFKFFFSPSK